MPRHAPVTLAEVDLADIDGFADERGYAQFDVLRAEDPVHWNPESRETNGKGFTQLGGYYEDEYRKFGNDWKMTSTRFVCTSTLQMDITEAVKVLFAGNPQLAAA